MSRVTPEAPQCAGIEIGGTKIQVVVGRPDGCILDRRRYTVDKERGADGIRAQIREALVEFAATRTIGSIGIGFGGPVNRGEGSIACSHQIGGWSGFRMVEWVQSLILVPTTIENDANTAALGEALCGAGKGCNPVFYITMGSGVGGGLVCDGSVYHGRPPGDVEIGHVRLDRAGTILEHRCSGWAVDNRIREATRSRPDSTLAQLCAGVSRGEARYLAPALTAGDPVAAAVLSDVVDDLVHGLSHVVHLLHPEVMVLGGGLSLVGEPLRRAVEQRLPDNLMEVFRPGPRVVLAALGEDAVPVGALLLASKILPDNRPVGAP